MISVILVLVALLLPAVQQAREQARRMQCRNNLMQIGLALRNYESAHGGLPPGVVDPNPPITSVAQGYHFGWIVQILPCLEQSNVYRNFDFSLSVYDKRNEGAVATAVAVLTCPSSWGGGWRGSSMYSACHHDVEAQIDVDNRGVMYANSHVRRDDIEDGASNTIFAGESSELGSLGWASGTRATLRNTGTPMNAVKPARAGSTPVVMPAHPPQWVGGFGSYHVGGAQFLFGDGAVRFLGDEISMPVYQRLGNRADGELNDNPW